MPQRWLKLAVGDFYREPLLEFLRYLALREPMRRQGQPALRMVCRAQSIETPESTRQDNLGESGPLAPPVIPNAAQIIIRAGAGAG